MSPRSVASPQSHELDAPRSVTPPPPRAKFAICIEAMLVVLGYTLVVWLAMYPLFVNPWSEVVDPMNKGGAGLLGLPDVKMTVWTLDWVSHSLSTNPRGLFNANTFHPAPNLLAAAEHVIGHQPVSAPIALLGRNPVLAYQLDLLLTIALCGASLYALLRHWGVSRPAALFGGFVFALWPARTHYGAVSIQMIGAYYLPLVVLYLDRTLTTARWLPAAALGTFLLLQLLCGYYLAYMVLVALAAYGAGVLYATRGRLNWRGVALATAAAAAACAVMAVLSLPYLERRSYGAIAEYGSARLVATSLHPWRNLLLPPEAVREWGWSLGTGLMAYLGIVPICAATLALLRRAERPALDPRGWATAGAVGITVACYACGLGPELQIAGTTIPGPYALLAELVPGFSSMRSPARFSFVLIFGFAVLAGFGFDEMVRRLALQTRAAVLLLVIAFGVTSYEYDYFRFRFATQPVVTAETLPAAYQVLRTLAPGPLLEVPLHGMESIHHMLGEIDYVYLSMFHRQRILNGYSQYPPPSADLVQALAWQLPQARAVQLLRRTTGLRYVLVHLRDLPAAQRDAWESLDPEANELELIGRYGGDLLWQVRRDADVGELIGRLTRFAPVSETILGLPIRPVAGADRAAGLAFTAPVPTFAPAALRLGVDVEITNRGAAAWPVMASIADNLVTVGYRWRTPDGPVISEDLRGARLPFDLGPGEHVRLRLSAKVPATPAQYTLEVGLAQGGQFFPHTLVTPQIAVRPLSELMR